jgi:hypothetical protein
VYADISNNNEDIHCEHYSDFNENLYGIVD